MQNDEIQRVYNISEHQNQRYNGYSVPIYNEKTTNRIRKLSPKKKAPNTDMGTAPNKHVIRRKPKIKNSACSVDVIKNGIGNTNNFSIPKELVPFTEKYKNPSLNHFNDNAKQEVSSLESINSFLTKLNKNPDTNVNRVKLTNTAKYTDVNHIRFPEASGSFNYSKVRNNNIDEYDFKVNNVASQKLNSILTTVKTKKTEDFRKKDNEYLNYLSDQSYKLLQNNSHCERFPGKQEVRFLDTRKVVSREAEKNVFELNTEKRSENKLFLRAKRRKQHKSKWQMDSGTRHEALQRIRECVEVQENLQNDLFPLNVGETGFEKSDSDSSEEYANTFQNTWFHSMSEIEYDDVKRNIRLGQLYNELRRQLCQIKQNKCHFPTLTKTYMKSVVDTARTQPSEVMHCILESENLRTTTAEPLILSKKKCAIEGCKNVALPCMPTCVRHILLSEKQTLFEQCRVRDSNSFQCDKPVLNIKYHYPVCSLHSNPDFVLPDFSRPDIKYDEVRDYNVFTTCPDVYKTEFDLSNANSSIISAPPVSSKFEIKKKNNVNVGKCNVHLRSILVSKKKEKDKKIAEKKENRITKSEELQPKQIIVKHNEKLIKEEPVPSSIPEVNQNLLPDWVNLSSNHLVDSKTLENTLQNDFVNGFDINTNSIQSQIQDIMNSESSLSTDMLMGSHELPNYIQVEEMIEEVEITDETLDSSELNNQELVRSEDLNAVLKQLPPEAFNELFSDKNDSQWSETQALERVIEEMDVRKCALIDPSLLLEDIEPSYSNYTNNYDSTSLTESVETKFSDMTESCGQS